MSRTEVTVGGITMSNSCVPVAHETNRHRKRTTKTKTKTNHENTNKEKEEKKKVVSTPSCFGSYHVSGLVFACHAPATAGNRTLPIRFPCILVGRRRHNPWETRATSNVPVFLLASSFFDFSWGTATCPSTCPSTCPRNHSCCCGPLCHSPMSPR